MKLADIVSDSYELEKAEATSERISGLMRDGLERYEKAFNSKFIDIVSERGKGIGVERLPLESRDYSLGRSCDKFLKRKLSRETKVREDYYKMVPKSRPCQPSTDMDGTQMPPLGMVPLLVYTSGLKELFAGLKKLEQREMSNIFGINSKEMIKIFEHFHKIRNKCSHDQGQYRNPEFTFCLAKFPGPSEVKILHRGGVELFNLYNNLFGTMTLLGHMLSNLPHKNMYLSAGEWKYRMAEQLNTLPQEVLTKMGFPDEWLNHRIWRRSRRTSIQETSVMYGIDFERFERDYNSLDTDLKEQVDARTQYISNKLVEKGWDTGDNLIDNIEWTARACVLKSLLGVKINEDKFPMEHRNLAKVLANGSDDADGLVNALNDYHAEKIQNDSIVMYIQKGTSDEIILKQIERWMRFDKKRRDSDFDKSFLLEAKIVRSGGSIVAIKDIDIALMSPFVMNMYEDVLDSFEITHDNFFQSMNAMLASREKSAPEWFRLATSNKHRHRVFDVYRRALISRIGENGIKEVIYNNTIKKLFLWPQEMVVDLDNASPDFKVEIEEEYKLRDPEKLGCKPYEAIFHYPFMLEEDMEEKLQEKQSIKNPFSSVDDALLHSYKYYFSVIKKKLRDRIKAPYTHAMGMLPACKKMVVVGEEKFKATFHIEITLKDICIAEMESTIPIEVEKGNGGLYLNTIKMRRACSREADDLVRSVAKKVRRRV